MQQLAGFASAVSATARAFGEAEAAEEAPEKAQAAVEEAIQTDPETGEVSFGDLPEGRGYGKEVFNQAALRAYDAKINVAKTQKFIDLVNDNEDDPQAFLQQANEYTNAFLKSIPVSLRSKYEQSMRNSVVASFDKLNENFLTNQTNQNIQTVTNSINTLSDNAIRLAIENSPDAQEKLNEVFAEMAELKKLNPKYNVEQKKQELNNKIFEQTNIAKLDNITQEKGQAEAYQELNNILDNLPQGYSTEEAKSFEITAQQSINRTNSREMAIKQTEFEENQAYVEKTVNAIVRGEVVPEDDLNKTLEIVKGTDAEKIVLEAQELAQFAILSKTDRQKIIEDEQNKTIAERSGLLDKLVETNSSINNQLVKDPLGFAIKQGIVSDDESMDFATSIQSGKYEDSVELLKTRVLKAQTASNHYGQNIPPFTDAEFDLISASINNMTPEDKTAFVGFIEQGTQNSSLAANIYSKVAQKNQGVFAQAGAMFSYNPSAVPIIFKGQQEISNKNVKALNANDALAEFQNVVGEAIEGSNDRKNVLETAKMYLYGSAEDGQPTIVDFKEAIFAITGQISKVNGKKTILPQNVSANRFDEYLSDFDIENSNIADYEKIRAKRAFANGQIQATKGVNNYIIFGEDGYEIMNNETPPQPFVFTVNEGIVNSFIANKYSRSRRRRTQ